MILDLDKFFADGFPVALSAETDLDEGDNKQLDSQKLSNFFDTPMVIDEIRIQYRTPYSATYLPAYLNYGGTVRLKLSLGRYALSSVYVPVGCLGPSFGGGTLGYATYAARIYSPETVLTEYSNTSYTGYYRWKLPRPLLVPIGMPLEARLFRKADNISLVYPSADTSITVNVTYIGRVLRSAKLPRNVTAPIPYVGFFEHEFTTASVATSDQLDLYNPFVSTLNVQRLIGRWQTVFLDSVSPQTSRIGLDVQSYGGSTPIDFPLTQIRTFNGFNITNGFIPGNSIWESNTRSFNMNIALERGEGFEVIIDATDGLPATQEEGSSEDGSNTSLVTMIGWRNEKL